MSGVGSLNQRSSSSLARSRSRPPDRTAAGVDPDVARRWLIQVRSRASRASSDASGPPSAGVRPREDLRDRTAKGRGHHNATSRVTRSRTSGGSTDPVYFVSQLCACLAPRRLVRRWGPAHEDLKARSCRVRRLATPQLSKGLTLPIINSNPMVRECCVGLCISQLEMKSGLTRTEKANRKSPRTWKVKKAG